MRESGSSQRFAALHKAIGKMGREAVPAANAPDNLPANLSELIQLAESLEAPTVAETNPAARARPVVTDVEPVQWVPADAMHESAVKRAQRLARIRAERELIFERARIVETIGQLRLRKIESQVRESRSAVTAMEDRLKTGGHTGRLGWMEAQVARVRELVTQG
jgi:hypothetical protein